MTDRSGFLDGVYDFTRNNLRTLRARWRELAGAARSAAPRLADNTVLRPRYNILTGEAEPGWLLENQARYATAEKRCAPVRPKTPYSESGGVFPSFKALSAANG